jgi:hypothetical protein
VSVSFFPTSAALCRCVTFVRLVEHSVRCFRPLVSDASLQGAPPFFCRERTIVMAKLYAKSRFLTFCYN